MTPSFLTSLTDFARNSLTLARSFRAALDALAARIDPNDDPDAEPLEALPLLVILAATSFSAWMIIRWKIQPMQDLGHHIALASVVADYGRPGSLYTALYEPIDPIAANSLLYQFAGHVGRIVGVMPAIRAGIVFYVAGVPLANVYALRVFGRSAWGALLAVPLVYNMNFVAGFANLLFAAPFMVLLLPLFYRTILAPSWRRVVTTSVLFALLFLSHAHLFLWTGVLCFLMTLGVVVYQVSRSGSDLGVRVKDAASRVGVALAVVAPALVFFAHWYRRTFGAGRSEGAISNATAGIDQHFGAYFTPTHELFAWFGENVGIAWNETHGSKVVSLICVVTIVITLARMHRFRRPPILELACAITGLSYFFLPSGLQGHEVITQRQPAIALWLLPAMLSPVPATVSRAARSIAILLIALLSADLLHSWYRNLVAFEHEEAVGLSTVLAAAPPRLRLHYVKLANESQYFGWRPFWHVDKIYMAQGFGQVADTPGILSTSAIRYRSGVDIHRILDHSSGWPSNEQISKNFDLVLVRKWQPPPAMQSGDGPHWRLLRQEGDWSLWQSKDSGLP